MSDCKQPATEEQAPRQRVRGLTHSMKRLSKRALEAGRLEAKENLKGIKFTRPKTRGDCLQGENAQRPCPFASCRWNLALDVNQKNGGIKINFPDANGDVNWDAMPESCALDVADRAGITLEEVGEIVGLVRERIRQIETKGLAKIKALAAIGALAELAE